MLVSRGDPGFDFIDNDRNFLRSCNASCEVHQNALIYKVVLVRMLRFSQLKIYSRQRSEELHCGNLEYKSRCAPNTIWIRIEKCSSFVKSLHRGSCSALSCLDCITVGFYLVSCCCFNVRFREFPLTALSRRMIPIFTTETEYRDWQCTGCYYYTLTQEKQIFSVKREIIRKIATYPFRFSANTTPRRFSNKVDADVHQLRTMKQSITTEITLSSIQ